MKTWRQAAANSPGSNIDGTPSRPNRVTWNWRAFFRQAIFLAVLSGTTGAAASAQVALLVERASTYQQAAQGFKNAFANTSEVEQIEIDENGQIPKDILAGWEKTPPRLIVAIGTRAARAASQRLLNRPILYCLTLRPVENRLVGVDIGGIVLDAELPQQFEIIRKLLPNLRRLGVVYDELTSGSLVRQARNLLGPGIQIMPRNARTPAEAERQIRDLFDNVMGPTDAFWMLWDSVTANPANFRTLIELSLKNKVPLIVPARPFVEAGALVSVGANYEAVGRQLAHMTQQILAGQARPGNFRAVPPSELTLTINGSVARQIGVTIPRDLRADILAPMDGARAP